MALLTNRSWSDQFSFFALVAATVGISFWDRFLLGRIGLFTIAMVAVTTSKGLSTYLRYTLLTENELVHRTLLGHTIVAEYSSLNVIEKKGESLSILGRSLNINIASSTTDFSAATEILKQKVPTYLVTN